MRSLGTHRVVPARPVLARTVLGTGVAAVTAFALAACGTGQVAETAIKKPSVPGVNTENGNRSVSIRNLSVAYTGVKGYAAGDDAVLEVGLYNQTEQPVTVLISSQPATGNPAGEEVVSARQIGLVGASAAGAGATGAPSVAPEPSGSRNSGGYDDQDDQEEIPTPNPSESGRGARPSIEASAAPAGASVAPARIELAPLGSAVYLPDDAQKLQAIDLSGKLVPGASLNLVFEFSNGAQPLTVAAPVSIPLSPASRGPAVADEHAGEANAPDTTN
ncbi:hypothetical protein [Actinoplanes sp. TFC3]|uniref:hypothetical protein n=1 Tax=Actinoplanes sp. TFC3 TaxID=1710355 RepID=UPI00082C9705|nr:hypothetical protein [Actinoplanes sp. TFC3]